MVLALVTEVGEEGEVFKLFWLSYAVLRDI